MSLSRSSTLHHRDDFNRANGSPGANWTSRAGGSWAISSNKLRNTGIGEYDRIEYTGMAARGGMAVEALVTSWSANCSPRLYARWDSAADTAYFVTLSNWNDTLILGKRVAGVETTIASTGLTISNGVAYRVRIDAQDGRVRVWVDGVLKFNVADTSLDGVIGRAGCGSNIDASGQAADFDDFLVTPGTTLACSGLPVGFFFQVTDTSGGKRLGAASSGTATIDLLSASMPFSSVQVLDPSMTVVGTLALANDVWGGDVYAASGLGGGDAYSPADEGDLVLWLDAVDEGALQAAADGAALATIHDLAGYSDNYVQATGAAQPLYSATGAGGRAAFHCPDANRFMTGKVPQLFGAQDATAYLVIRRTDTGERNVFHVGPQVLNRCWHLGSNGSATPLFRNGRWQGASDTIGGPLTLNANRRATALRPAGGGTWINRVDGVQTAAQAGVAAQNISSDVSTLFQYNGGGGGYIGYLCALLIFRGVHNSTQIANVENYLRGRYQQQPPSAPGAFVTPEAGGVYAVSLDVEFGAATDPEDDPLTYEIQSSWDGGATWQALASGLATPAYTWDLTAEPPGPDWKLRARASDGSANGPWTMSGTFTVGTDNVPDKPTITVTPAGGTTADLQGTAYSHVDGLAHAASQWQIDELGGDWSDPVFDSGDDADHKASYPGAGPLVALTEYQARGRYKDANGNWSAWSDLVAFKTGQDADLVEISSGLIWRDDFDNGDLVGWQGQTAGSQPLNVTNVAGAARAGSAGVNADRMAFVVGQQLTQGVLEATIIPRTGPEPTLGRFGFVVCAGFGLVPDGAIGTKDRYLGIEYRPYGAQLNIVEKQFIRFGDGVLSGGEYGIGTVPAIAAGVSRNLKLSFRKQTSTGQSEMSIFPLAELASPHVAPLFEVSPPIEEGMVGLYGTNANVNDYDNFRLYSGYIIEVRRCPPNSRAELVDAAGNVLAAAPAGANGGSAFLWCKAISFPYSGHAKVRVVKAADNSLITEIAPASGVWGGGIYDAQYAAGQGGQGSTLAGPNKPTLDFGTICKTSAVLTGSAYADPSGSAHAATRWQVAKWGTNFAQLVVDTQFQAQNKLSYTALGLVSGTDYEARVAYRNAAGVESAWSDPVPFTAAVAFYTSFGEYEPGDIITDFGWLATLDASHNPPFTIFERDDAVCQRIMRRSGTVATSGDSAIYAPLGRFHRLTTIKVAGFSSTAGSWGLAASVRSQDSAAFLNNAQPGLPHSGAGYFATLFGGNQLRVYRGSYPGPGADGLLLVQTVAIPAYTTADRMAVMIQAEGDVLRAKAWKIDAEVEPVGWQIEVAMPEVLLWGVAAPSGEGVSIEDFDQIWIATGCMDLPTGLAQRPPKPVIIVPTIGETYTDVVYARWQAGSGSAAALKFDADYSRDGLTWTPIFRALRAFSYDWNVSRLPASAGYYFRLRAAAGCEFSDWAVVGPFGVASSGPPPAQVDPTCLRDAPEIWSDLPANGGQRLCWINDFAAIYDHRELQGVEQLTIEVPPTSLSWQYVQGKRVVRIPYTNGSAEWWRIQIPQDGRDDQDAAHAKIECDGITADLGVRRAKRQVGTTVLHDWGLYQVAPLGHASELLTNAPPWFRLGTVQPARKLTQKYSGVSVLEGLRLLAEESESELQVTPEGSEFLVHLVEEIGSDADVAYLRYADNLRGITRTADFSRLANRIYPLGADVDGVRQTMAGHAWKISSVDPATGLVTFEDEPIFLERQLDDLYAWVLGTTIRSRVIATDVDAQGVRLESPTGFAVGKLVRFCLDEQGTELTYLQAPDSQDRWRGVYEDVVDRQDIPAVDNLLFGAFLDAWTGGVPDGWALVGAPAVEVNTDPLYYRLGNASAHVVATADGQGLETALTPVAPDATHPYFSAQTSLFVKAGAVRVELLAFDAAGNQVATYPPSDQKARSTVLNNWIDDLGLGGLDLHAVGATQVKVRVLADGGGAEFYLDGAMVTQTAGGAPEFYAERGSNALWRAAIRELVERMDPAIAYDIDFLDLFRYNPTAFAAKKVVMGGTVVADDPLMRARARVVELDRDYVRCAVTKARVATQNDLLTKLLEQERERRDRLSIKPPTSTGGTPTAPPPTTPPDPGTANPAGQISNFAVVTATSFNPPKDIPQWNHNSTIETAAAGRFTVRVLRQIGAAAAVELVTGRDPTLEYDGGNYLPGMGSYAVDIDLAAENAPGAVQATITYTLELYDGATLVDTKVSSRVAWVYSDAAIFGLTVEHLDAGGGSWVHQLSWKLTSGIESAAAGTYELRIYRNGALQDTVDPRLEWDGTDSTPLEGSWREAMPAPCAGPGTASDCAFVHTDYLLELVRVSDGAVLQTLTTSIEGWYSSSFLA